mmetsp:Transcript_10637/g.45318  ORF Transcript_10637/g.45318 Transcript_10637/m.45318 type:complete len:236 (+) Transcript_10637:2575-3282(+)
MRRRFCPPRRLPSLRRAPSLRLLRRRHARKRDSRAIRARSSGTGGRVRRGSRRRAPATSLRPWTRRGARTATARRSTGSPRRFPPDASRRRSQIRGEPRRARLRLRRKKASSSRVRPGDPKAPRLFSRALVARARLAGRGWRRRRARRGRAAESPTYDITVSHESRDPPKTPSLNERRKNRPTTTPTRRRSCTRRRRSRRLRRRSGTDRRRLLFFRRLCAARTWRRSTRTARRPP